jgi:transposase
MHFAGRDEIFPRRRALGLLALNSGRRVVDICEILRVSDQPEYNWAKGWREKGLVGILDGHKGGAPLKLTVEMLDAAAETAQQGLSRNPRKCRHSKSSPARSSSKAIILPPLWNV